MGIAANNSSSEWLSTAQSALIAALGKSNVPEEPSARHLLSWVSYLVDPKNTEQLEDKAICAKMWKTCILIYFVTYYILILYCTLVFCALLRLNVSLFLGFPGGVDFSISRISRPSQKQGRDCRSWTPEFGSQLEQLELAHQVVQLAHIIHIIHITAITMSHSIATDFLPARSVPTL